MTLFGPDLSNNQWNSVSDIPPFLDACFHREGFSFMEHKVSEGDYYRDPFWPAVRDWCAANSVPCIGYHYVTTNDADSQAQTWVANGGGPNAMLDFEANSGGIGNFWAVVNAFNRAGVNVTLSYIPHWYWQDIGSPDISTVPGLISSAYYERGTYASVEYADAGGDSGSGWNSYGGASPVIWQFSDGGIIDGKSVDVNAFRGTEDELIQLFGGDPYMGLNIDRVNAAAEKILGVWGSRSIYRDNDNPIDDTVGMLLNIDATTFDTKTELEAFLGAPDALARVQRLASGEGPGAVDPDAVKRAQFILNKIEGK